MRVVEKSKCQKQRDRVFPETLTETFMRKYYLVLFDFYRIAWKEHPKFDGIFKLWSSAVYLRSSSIFKCL